MKIKCGDMVRHKTGGPMMYVNRDPWCRFSSPGEFHVEVEWFNDNGDLNTHTFMEDVLVVVSKEKTVEEKPDQEEERLG